MMPPRSGATSNTSSNCRTALAIRPVTGELQRAKQDEGYKDVCQVGVNAPGLNGSHSGGEAQQEILQWFIEPFLERRLDVTLEMDRFWKIRGHIEDGLNRTSRLGQNREDHTPRL